MTSPQFISPKPNQWARLSTPVQLLCVLLVSFAIFMGSIPYGYHDARKCAIDYPHDGQCGLQAMVDWSFGLLFGVSTLVGGGLLVAFRRARQRSETESAHDK